MIDLDKIKKLAKAATPGTWDAVLHAHGTGVENDDEQLFIEQYGLTYTANPSDALFIAAANPGAILELIERVRQAEARIAEAANLHRPTLPGFGPKSCTHDGRAWPCPDSIALGLNEGSKT